MTTKVGNEKKVFYKAEAIKPDGVIEAILEAAKIDDIHDAIDLYIKTKDPDERSDYRIIEATVYSFISNRALRREAVEMIREAERAAKLARKRLPGPLPQSSHGKKFRP